MTDIEIARSTKLEEIETVASKYGILQRNLNTMATIWLRFRHDS